jgi:hypothetical protein
MTPSDQGKLKDYVGLRRRTHRGLAKHVQEACEKRKNRASSPESFNPIVHAETVRRMNAARHFTGASLRARAVYR